MAKLKGTIAIAVLLSLFQLQNVNAVLKYLEQSYTYSHKQVMYNEYAFKQGNLVYAVCDGTTTEKNCTVFQRQFSNDLFMRSCNVTLKVQHPENVNITDRVAVRAFGQENVILFWGEVGPRAKFHLMALHLNNCKTKVLQLDDPDQLLFSQQINTHKIVTYDNGFDVFFQPSNLTSVNDQVLTRIRVNQEFHPTYDVIKKSGDGTVRFVSPIATRSSDKGYVYYTSKKRDYHLWLVKPDGTDKLLANHKNQLVGTSAGYDLITSCANIEMDSQTICTQYDENGNVKFTVTLEHDRKTAVMWQVVHNTPRGGFLLMTTSLKMSGDDANYHIKPSDCEIVRVDGEGKRVGSIRLKGFVERVENAKTHSIWESKDQYCAASIGQVENNTSVPDNLDVAVNCFNENDFIA